MPALVRTCLLFTVAPCLAWVLPRAPARARWATMYLGQRDTVEVEIADGQTLRFETGKIGKQAGGSVMAYSGDTMVYSTACAEAKAQDLDFTPLKIDYLERFSAAGKTSGAFHRRDGRAADHEILVARLIDRPIRPMLANGWTHDTQLLSWVLSYDGQQQPDALAVCCASAALCLSDVPLTKPVAAVQVGLVEGALVLNPTRDQMDKSSLQLMIAGTSEAVLMIEVGRERSARARARAHALARDRSPAAGRGRLSERSSND